MTVSKLLLVESNLQGEVIGLPGKFQCDFYIQFIHIVLDVKKFKSRLIKSLQFVFSCISNTVASIAAPSKRRLQ